MWVRRIDITVRLRVLHDWFDNHLSLRPQELKRARWYPDIDITSMCHEQKVAPLGGSRLLNKSATGHQAQ
jgi:hypothetical protein